MTELIWFALGVGAGFALHAFWVPISSWMKGEVSVVITGTQAQVKKVVDDIRAKL